LILFILHLKYTSQKYKKIWKKATIYREPEIGSNFTVFVQLTIQGNANKKNMQIYSKLIILNEKEISNRNKQCNRI